MADLMVTLGADSSELEKKVKQAGKTIEKELGGGDKKGKGVMGGIDFATNLMSGNIGAAIGGLFGPVGQAVGQFVDVLLGKAKELMDQAIQLRAMSMQTNMSTQQIQGLEGIAKATGISVGKLADSISEYNRRVGYARTHGSEMNYLLTKMGVSFETIKNGTFTYFDAIDALAKAQAAGTDEAILNHYAQVMLGSSYKEMLPLIKMGSDNLKGYSERIYKTSKESIDALTEAGDAWNEFTESVKNMAMDMLGWLYSKTFAVDAQDVANAMTLQLAGNDSRKKEILQQVMRDYGGGKTDAQKKQLGLQAIDLREKDLLSLRYDPAKVKADMDEQRKIITDMFTKQKGVNLNPFGAGPALGASQMQQMGGGDLFGAVSFNPAQETANNTKIAAEQITQLNSKVQPSTQANPEREGLNK
jgi:hypothetical protein